MRTETALHWKLLSKAASQVEAGEFGKYFELKRLLASPNPKDRRTFQKQFTDYYRLRIGGLTDEFTRRYFELLFACAPVGQEDPYTPLLLDLHRFPRRKGDDSIQASFVSKLVAIHDESRPIFDRHVSHFFGLGVPKIGSTEFRVAGFVSNLRSIQEQYGEWSADPRFRDLETALYLKQPKLKDCHRHRLCDFLVWTVGSKKLI